MHFFDANAHAKSKPQRRLRSIHSKESKRRNPSFEFRPHQTSQPASSHPRPVSSTESRLRNPSFEFRPHHCHQTSKPASSHPRPRNPSFEIHASDFGDIETTRRLRRIHVHEIQASDFDLCCNRYDHRTIAFLLYTFVGNDGQRAPALTRQQVGARAFSRRARSHLACPLSQSTPAAGSRWPVSMRERRGRRRTVWGQAL